ncbi:hypothetical protein JCM10212_005647 [Sporobolomyces blumeae]
MISRFALNARLPVARGVVSSTRQIIAPTSSARSYATGTEPKSPGPNATSTSESTIPHKPPKPTPFFAWKNIGLEVTPLMAFIAAIALVATGSLVRNLIQDPDIHQRHGVPNDDKLKKVLEMPDEQPSAKENKK